MNSFKGTQDNFISLIIWLAPQAGKLKQILCSDSLPKWARWAYVDHLGLPALFPPSENLGEIFWPYNKSFIDQAYSVKMARYWPCSFLRFNGPQLRFGP